MIIDEVRLHGEWIHVRDNCGNTISQMLASNLDVEIVAIHEDYFIIRDESIILTYDLNCVLLGTMSGVGVKVLFLEAIGFFTEEGLWRKCYLRDCTPSPSSDVLFSELELLAEVQVVKKPSAIMDTLAFHAKIYREDPSARRNSEQDRGRDEDFEPPIKEYLWDVVRLLQLATEFYMRGMRELKGIEGDRWENANGELWCNLYNLTQMNVEQRASALRQAKAVWDLAIRQGGNVIWVFRSFPVHAHIAYAICALCDLSIENLLEDDIDSCSYKDLTQAVSLLFDANIKAYRRPEHAGLSSIPGVLGEKHTHVYLVCEWELSSLELEEATRLMESGMISIIDATCPHNSLDALSPSSASL